MQVILQGSLRHFPVAELLTFLCNRGQSGTLDLESAGRKSRILFHEERILWAESSRGGQTLDVVIDAFDWMEGTFTLIDTAVVPETVAPAVIELKTILDEARKRAEAASSFPDGTFFRVVDDPALQQQVSLTADQFKLLFRLAAGKSFRDLVAELAMPRKDLAERLRSLLEVGLVTMIPEMPPPDHTIVARKRTGSRRRTLVGSLTPDHAPDNVFPLLEAEYTIGRTADNKIPVADGSVSSKHARITRTPEGFVLEDLQSRNGTFVNGERLDQPRVLADGDLIRLGKVILTFNVARESKVSETTTPELRVG